MTKHEVPKLFEDRKIRTVWDDKEEKWYFSIVDVVAVLTDSADPKQYIKRMKSRDEGLKAKTGRNVISPLSAKRSFEEQRPNKELEDGEEKEE